MKMEGVDSSDISAFSGPGQSVRDRRNQWGKETHEGDAEGLGNLVPDDLEREKPADE